MESPCHPTGQSSAGLLSTESWIEDLPSLEPQCVILLCYQTSAQEASAKYRPNIVIAPVFRIFETTRHKDFLKAIKRKTTLKSVYFRTNGDGYRYVSFVGALSSVTTIQIFVQFATASPTDHHS